MPKVDELIFALKTFAGAMAALGISLWLGQDNPYWSMASAYIVSQPFSGALRSKAVYRFFGTFIGGIAAVALVPNLVNAPVLLTLAMALWVGLCLYISLLDRSPRAYTFMLAGYTAGIIGFPAVTDPGNIFLTALTRVEEISIGIACSTVFGTLIFPRAMGPMLARRIAAWVHPALDWATAALAGDEDTEPAKEARRKLAFEATDAAMMISMLAYDTSHLQTAVRHATRLRIYLISLMPVLSSIGDRVAQLSRLGGVTPPLAQTLDHTNTWLRTGKPDGADTLLTEINALETASHDWNGLLRASLALRLEELVRIVHHSRIIRGHVLDGAPVPATKALDAEYIAVLSNSRDHKLGFLSAFAAFLAIIAVCALWIFTAWPAGAGAAIMVAVGCSFFAAQDNPAPAIQLMLRNSVIAVAGVFVYMFGILPWVDNFAELFLVLLPAGLVIGVLVSRPATFGTGMVLGAFGATQLALGNGYNGTFPSYANSSIALVVGIGSALVITRLIRSVGAAWSAERLLRANWRDVAATAEASQPQDRAKLTGIMMDRLGLMMPRLANVASGADAAASTVLRDLRVGLNTVALHREEWRLPEPALAPVQRVFAGIAAYYRADPRRPAPQTLCAGVDDAMAALMADPLAHRAALMVLSGLRSVLFPLAPPPDLVPAASLPQEAA